MTLQIRLDPRRTLHRTMKSAPCAGRGCRDHSSVSVRMYSISNNLSTAVLETGIRARGVPFNAHSHETTWTALQPTTANVTLFYT